MASRPCCQVCQQEQKVMKRCTNCRKVYYCSRECQITNWNSHKNVCNDSQATGSPVTTTLLPVRLKCNKQIIPMDINTSSPADAMIQTIADAARVPKDKLKIIRKGKCLTGDNIKESLKANDLLLILGEVMESEDGLSDKDIRLVMGQIGAERNVAIRALRSSSGDVVQAILEIGNKS